MHPKKIHLIAIGGSVMACLAIDLKKQGYIVSGSDNKIYNPSKSNLQNEGLLPHELGWFPEKLDTSIGAVILGMHATKNNPEILKAQQLNIPIYSFPDYILHQSKQKQRIVIGGSHGKTTITALLIHTLLFHKRKFDYVVGAQIEGIGNSVKLTKNAPIIIIEGDEYSSSAIDKTPKFLKYKHHIGVISGVEWDHANVFPSKDIYIEQFKLFADATPKGGVLIYNSEDDTTNTIGKMKRIDVVSIPYKKYNYTISNNVVWLKNEKSEKIPIHLFGLHNIQNIAAAGAVLKKIGITTQLFHEALPHFKGAKGRLNVIFKTKSMSVYRDFAHSPSKVQASTKAVKNLYPKRILVGCIELHTLSSLNPDFLPEYKGSMNMCDVSIIYYHPNTKNQITENEIKKAFGDDGIKVFTNNRELTDYLTSFQWSEKNLLMMSSGNFNALDLNFIIKKMRI